jgi:hypothetical protein
VEPGNEKAPRICETLRVGEPNLGTLPTCTCRSVTIGQAIGQVSWSPAVDLPAVAAASGQFGHRGLPPGSPEPAPIGTSGQLARTGRPGPRWVREASEPAGPQRAPTVNLGMAESQVRRLLALQPRTAKKAGAGFESHLPTPRRR